MGAAFDPTADRREMGSTWLVVSGPPGSKVVETFDGGRTDAREYAAEMTARGVEAEVKEMVSLAYPITLRVDVERAGVEDGALLSTLLAKALLRTTDAVLDSALAAGAEDRAEARKADAPKIVVPTMTMGPRPARRG